MMAAEPNWAEIQRWQQFLKHHLAATRLVPVPSLAKGMKSEVFLKLESGMPALSLEVRGSLSALQARRARGNQRGCGASTGNHGAAMSVCSARHGHTGQYISVV
jgi:threonine dehydratase